MTMYALVLQIETDELPPRGQPPLPIRISIIDESGDRARLDNEFNTILDHFRNTYGWRPGDLNT